MVAPGVRLIAVVKADAYGHGLPEVARQLDRETDLFGVASLSEAQTIRSTGAQAPVLILGPALPEERQTIVDDLFIPSVSTVEEAKGYAECVRPGDRFPIQFVIDTGMGRIGSSEEEADQVFRAVSVMTQLQVKAVSSHLPVADEDENYTVRQLGRFLIRNGRGQGRPPKTSSADVLQTLACLGIADRDISADAKSVARIWKAHGAGSNRKRRGSKNGTRRCGTVRRSIAWPWSRFVSR